MKGIKVQHLGSTDQPYWIMIPFHLTSICDFRNKIIAHKTFHRYTVRAKRGTAQSLQDKKQGHTSK